MLHSLKNIVGHGIEATDGPIGSVYDVYFWDDTWRLKWFVIDTGTWLPNRKVLVNPDALDKLNFERRVFPVAQTRQEILDSPDHETDPPVAHQESDRGWARFYRWVPYMPAGSLGSAPLGTGGYALPIPTPTPAPPEEGEYDRSLRSAITVAGYRIGARDGEIGHVEDFILDDEDWTLPMLVVDTRNWLPAKKVALATEWVSRIVLDKAEVEVNLRRETIRESPRFDPNEPINHAFAGRMYDYYGRRHDLE